jgi:predicted small metal-binding protein
MKDMKREFFKIGCPCGFKAEDHNRSELIKIVKIHFENTHNQKISDQEAEKEISRV